jgi:hypothetical protein
MAEEVEKVSNPEEVEMFSYKRDGVEYFTPHERLAATRTDEETYNIFRINLQELREQKKKKTY